MSQPVERVVMIKARRIDISDQIAAAPAPQYADEIDRAVAEGRISVRRAARIRAAQ